MAKLSKAAILAAQDTQPVEVPVPEWGGEVYLKPLTTGEMRQLFDEAKGEPDMVPLLAMCAVDPDMGELLFTREDVEELRRKNVAVVSRLVNKAQALCGLGEEAPKG